MSETFDHADHIRQQIIDNRQYALKDAYRNLGEHGLWTMTLTIERETGKRFQAFASMNAVDTGTAKAVCSVWIHARYGDCDIEYRQMKWEHKASTEDRLYFHAVITSITGFHEEDLQS